jgi:acyl carrier protein
MSSDSRLQPVRDFIIQNFLFGKSEGLTDSQSFLDTGIIDSTGILELVAFLEKHYGIKVEDAELVPENLDSINNISKLLEAKLGAAAV